MVRNIKYLVLDVDGTLTDGKIYMGNDGEMMKAFSVKDGYAINYILKPNGIEPIIITARRSDIVLKRCEELGITAVYQGKVDKLNTLTEIVGEENLGCCAYFGDDILDLKCMLPIKAAGGIIGCPSDAVKDVRLHADYVTESTAGNGAMREFSEWIVSKDAGDNLETRIIKAVDYILNLKGNNLECGRYIVDDSFYYIVQEYETKSEDLCQFKSHRKYVDIQFIVCGEEIMEVASTEQLVQKAAYDEDKDITIYMDSQQTMRVVLKQGSYIVLYPKNAHKGCILNGDVSNVKKIVGKVAL